MQKGTVCGADRSVYKLHFFPWISFFIFVLHFLSMFHIFCIKAWLENVPEMFTFLTTLLTVVAC